MSERGATLTEYATSGYAVVPGGVPLDTLAEVRDWLAREALAVSALLDARIREVTQTGGALDPPERALRGGNFPPEVKGSPRLWDLFTRSPRLLSTLRSILESERLYLHMYPSPRHVPPFQDEAGVPRHIDRQYNAHLADFVTVWVPIDCFERDVGGVVVHPGSHLHKRAWADVAVDEGGLWFEPLAAPDDGVQLVLAPGDVLLLHPDVLHASMLNRSARTRLSCDFRFFGDRTTTTKHYLDLAQGKVFAPGTGERHG